MKALLTTLIFLTASSIAIAQDIPLSKILVEKEGWREIAKDWPNVTLLEGEVVGSIRIYQPTPAGQISPTGEVTRLPKVVVGKEMSAASVQGPKGTYTIATDLKGKKAVHFKASAKKDEPMLKLPGLITPSCVTLWPDDGHLVIGEADGAYLWAVRIEADGSFGPGDRYYSLRTRPKEPLPVSAMVMDAGFLMYACTPLGVQVFDPTGRLSGVVASPSKEPMTAITIGGEKADQLFIAAGDRIYARRIQAKAAYTLKKAKQ
ncbi:MAG: hypothetical protein EXS16_13725 [Gemmataceae bacterium]|nr:hypothetical protein [Gemmataceae bacterium]